MLLYYQSWMFYNHFKVILYHFLVLTYWHRAQYQLLFTACFLHRRKSIPTGVQKQRNFLRIFLGQKNRDQWPPRPGRRPSLTNRDWCTLWSRFVREPGLMPLLAWTKACFLLVHLGHRSYSVIVLGQATHLTANRILEASFSFFHGCMINNTQEARFISNQGSDHRCICMGKQNCRFS